MDLNVKLQGQKYNFGKVWDVFCKIQGLQGFSKLNELFSYRKMHEPGL
jgi:hypothetical protein